MPSLFSRISSAVKAFRFSSSGGGGFNQGSWGAWDRTLPGSQYDYRTESGNLWENSVAFSLMNWQAKQFNQASICVEEPGDKPGEWSHIDQHPLTRLIMKPNDAWTRRQMWGATLLSTNCSGHAYWIKVKSAADKPVQLWWVPHWMMWPVWPQNGSEFISGYKYKVEGKEYFYKTSDVVHFRNDIVNPVNQRYALGTFSASLREVCTENEAATLEAAFYRNAGYPGTILSPKERVDSITPEKAKEVKKQYREAFSGDGAGGVFLSSLPLDVNMTQFDPERMAFAVVHGIAASRIAAPTGIDTMVIGLQSDQKTYSNYEEANRGAWEHNILPTQGSFSETLDWQLLNDFDDPYVRHVAFDNSRVSALQEKRDDLYKRISLAVGGPWLTPNEGRAEAGLDEIDDGDQLTSVTSAQNALELAAAKPAPAIGEPRKAILDAWNLTLK